MQDPLARRAPDNAHVRRYLFAVLAALLIIAAVFISVQRPAANSRQTASLPRSTPASAPPTTTPPVPTTAPEDRGLPAPIPPTGNERTSARRAAQAFAAGLRRCLDMGARCSPPPEMLPAYAGKLVAYLHGATRQRIPRLAGLSMSFYCQFRAISTVRFSLASGNSLVLHPNLVRQPHGWKVYLIPELPIHITPPPPPLHIGAQGTC